MNSPIDRLHEDLRRRADQKVDERLGPFRELRIAMDAYEAAVRHHEETKIARSIAPDVAADDGELPDRDATSAAVRDAAQAVVEWLAPVVASNLASKPEGADSNEEEDASSETEAAPVEDAPSSSKPLSQAELSQYWEGLKPTRIEKLPDPAQVRARERQTLVRLLELVDDIPELTGDVAIIEELDRMDEVTADEARERWGAFGDRVLQAWLTMLVARLRAVRDRLDYGSQLHQRHGVIIKRLPEYRDERASLPYVHGMAKVHAPAFGSWAEDARRALSELRELSGIRAVETIPEPPASKKRARAPKTEAAPIEWPYRSAVVDMHVLLYGGAPREEQRANIEQSLGIGEVSWPESNRPRRVAALVEGISQFDVLLVTKYVSHKEANALVAAAKSAGVPFRVVDTYGVDTVRSALTDVLEREPERRVG